MLTTIKNQSKIYNLNINQPNLEMKKEPNTQERRDFLKASALLAGGAMLSSMPLAGAYASGTDTIKIALIGCGDRGTGAAFQALSTKFNIKLVAMADAFQDRLDSSYQSLSSKFAAKMDVPKERQFVGFDAYLKAIPLADVVLLVTPPGFRPIHFEEAIKQGKHVFMEKPGEETLQAYSILPSISSLMTLPATLATKRFPIPL